MRPPDDSAPLTHTLDEPAESPRYGSTLSGCLGLVCVLALPVLLFLPLDGLALAPPIARLFPLAGVALSGLGVWLVARVPAAGRRAGDPLRPLTSGGQVPLRELPATRANRIGFAVAVALSALCAVGAVLVIFAPHTRDVLGGALLCAAAGSVLSLYAILAARGMLPAPALHWLRQPIRGGGSPPIWFLLVGGISLVWALIVAFEAGYAWAAAASTLVILLGLLAGPAGQRLPSRGLRR
jgi:hypothetical protein